MLLIAMLTLGCGAWKQRPDHITDFSRMCDGGRAFSHAAPYRGPGPHPMVLYEEGSKYPEYVYVAGLKGGTRSWPAPGDVRLVGCRRLVGRASQKVLKSCDYEGGHTVTVYQGRYRVDIYAVRTGRLVASLTIDGSSDPGACSDWILVNSDSDEPKSRSYETGLDEEDYAARLAPLGNGYAR